MRTSGVGSGGGYGSKQVVKVGVKAGPQRTSVVNPGGVAQMGAAPGGKMRGETHTSINSAVRIEERTARTPVPLGNALATNVGKGGPGTGRTVYASGSQHGLRPAQPLPAGRDTLSEYGPDVPGRRGRS
jgi:hypothetical protein